MFIVGIDIAKRAHVLSVMTSEGQIVCKPFSIHNNCSGTICSWNVFVRSPTSKACSPLPWRSLPTTGSPSIPVCAERDGMCSL